MRLPVRLFAAARDLAGAGVVTVELPDGATVADLRRALAEQHPRLAALAASARFALDADYAPDSAVIPPAAEAACIPPVSGG